MSHLAQENWIVLSPPFPKSSIAEQVFRAHAVRLSELLSEGVDGQNLDEAIQDSLHFRIPDECATALRAMLCILTDLARQHWSIQINEGGEVEVKRPLGEWSDPRQEKARIRAQEAVKRNEQLREPAVRRFIKEMEKKSVHDGHFVSIYSVIRDGRELADSLRTARPLTGDERIRALGDVISPYLQLVNSVECCDYTGLRLQDIWRYFRHTWTNQYTSTPGRSMAFLIRDRAREYHPVVGIGALGSPIIEIGKRDAWIGWQPEAFMEFVGKTPSAELGNWLHKTVEKAIGEIYLDDFFEEELLSPIDLRAPTPEVLERLIAHGEKQRELHHRFAISQDLKRSAKSDETGSNEAHWKSRTRTHLYRSKRALLLVDMLRSRMVLQQHLSSPPVGAEMRALLDTGDGRRVVKKILRKAKADRVGVAMADITVCGAVAPYNPILGGKLVSMLAASPEIVNAYREKYVEQESEIASSMAGRPIVRSSDLVFLGTTSLYGVGSSQYNRLRMPAARIGGEEGENLAFIKLGKSKAYGTSHFSSDTVSALVSLVQQSSNGQRVNSLFGEGVSPKLRKIRDGLNALNLPADALLRHGRERIVYGVPVVRNLFEFLLGMDDEPDYLFVLDEPERSTEEIGCWWTERWLQKRIDSDDVLAQIEQHTLVRPIRHGARVVLPRVDDDQTTLFDDLEHFEWNG
jgi:hypothetical protein